MAAELYDEILPHIENAIYPLRLPISDWKFAEGEIKGAQNKNFKDKSWQTFQVPGTWGKHDKTFWFRRSLTTPAEWSGKPVVLLLEMPEALVYVDGEPIQGVDSNHDQILLTQKARTNQTLFVAIEAYSGRKSDLNKFHRSEIAVIDFNAHALFHCLRALHDLSEQYEHGSQESKTVRELIRRTLIFLKYFRPGSEEYPNAIGRAYNFLMNTIASEPQGTLPGLVHLVGQSHLDVAWLWTTRETRKKCGRTFSTVLRLMEEYPAFKFSQSQAVLYEFTKASYPHLYKQIKQRILEGRWIPTGAMWVETDANIPSGESLIRQILLGKKYFKTEFGIDANVAWLPDSFGFSWAMPQILRKSGIEYFFTTKLTWNDTNKFPFNTFWWQGIDGTRILAHQPPVGLEGSITPKDVAKSWEDFVQKEQKCSSVLQTYGFGDGGGGPTRWQLEAAKILKNATGLPQTSLSNAQEFFQQATQQIEEIPTLNADLYLEKHRGTYTTHGWIKRANRLAERQLYEAELFSVLGLLYGRSARSRTYPSKELEQTWKKLLVNQFHDIVTGTSIPDALEEARTRFGEIESTTSGIVRKVLADLTERTSRSTKEFHFTVFNTLGWERNEYVELEVATPAKFLTVTTDEGKPIEHQVIKRAKGKTQLLCYVEGSPPYSCSSFVVKPANSNDSTPALWEISAKQVESPLLRLRFDGKGYLSSCYDKKMKKELIEKGKRGNVLEAFKDVPDQWDAWDISPNFERQHLDLFTLKKRVTVESGPLRAIIRNVYVSNNGSDFTQDIILYHKRPQLVFKTNVHWKEKQTLLKVSFPFNVKANQATFETQFGAFTRTTRHKTDFDRARFEVPVQQWADVADAKFGVTVLNDCKYGCDTRDNTYRLTLIRSPFYPHPIEPWRFNDVKHTDQGEHEFSYALSSHPGDWKTGESTRRAREFNNPLLLVENVAGKATPPLLSCNKHNIFIDSVKKAEESDEIVIRAHEGDGEATDAVLNVGFKSGKVTECDLQELEIKPLKLAKGRLQVKFKPFEIKTFRFEARGGRRK